MTLTNDNLYVSDSLNGIKYDFIIKQLDGVALNVRDIQLTMENEINCCIQLISEGDMSLSRRPIKFEPEKEMLLIRVNRLENELRRIKELLNQIA